MNRYRFIKELKEYFEEASDKNWPNCVIDFDLNRMFDRYDSDFENSIRDALTLEYREILESAQDAIEEAHNHLY